MPRRKQILWRLILAAVSLLVLLGVLAPFLSAERFAARVRTALESSLGRKVEFQTVRFNLFRGPVKEMHICVPFIYIPPVNLSAASHTLDGQS